jgi:O-antigen/teichoic acid export membrane protein
VVLLIFNVVLGPTAGYVAAGVVFVVLLGLWVVLPLVIRERKDADEG